MNVLIIGAAGKTGRWLSSGLGCRARCDRVRSRCSDVSRAGERPRCRRRCDRSGERGQSDGRSGCRDRYGRREDAYRKTRSSAASPARCHSDEGERSVGAASSSVRSRRRLDHQVGWFVNHVVVPTWLRGSTEDKAAVERLSAPATFPSSSSGRRCSPTRPPPET